MKKKYIVLDIQDDKPLQEKCGIVAVVTSTYTAQLPLTLLAGSGVQHRGQHGAGLAMQTAETGLQTYTKTGLLREIFTEKVIKKLTLPAQWTILHCRYGTNGGYEKTNLQPIIGKTPDGSSVAVAHNGEFVGTEQMRKRLNKKVSKKASDTYLFTQLLLQAEGDSWDERIHTTLDEVNGAFSLLIGVPGAVFAARDKMGIRPLMIGQLEDGWIVASETHALEKVGARNIRSIARGELVKIDKDGVQVIKGGTKSSHHFCDLEWAYFSRPNSFLPVEDVNDGQKYPTGWLSTGAFREKCGKVLAEEAPFKNATFAVGIPSSGRTIATGYAHALRIPYREVIVRDHHDPFGNHRLFMRDDQKQAIAQRVLGKLCFLRDPATWKNAIVVVGDDSIIRGNVSAQITGMIFSLGAKEVHWIIGFPSVAHPCHLGVSIRTHEELIAYRQQNDPQKIAKELGATSVNYISPRGFIKARLLSGKIKAPKNDKSLFLANGGCGGCITGVYPVNREGISHSSIQRPPQQLEFSYLFLNEGKALS